MANNFRKKEAPTDEPLTNCVICRYGIYKIRHSSQHLANPDPKLTGRIHSWHLNRAKVSDNKQFILR